jgi:hypothetical protein
MRRANEHALDVHVVDARHRIDQVIMRAERKDAMVLAQRIATLARKTDGC